MGTNQMGADGFTKALPAQKHKKIFNHINLVDVNVKNIWFEQLSICIYSLVLPTSNLRGVMSDIILTPVQLWDPSKMHNFLSLYLFSAFLFFLIQLLISCAYSFCMYKFILCAYSFYVVILYCYILCSLKVYNQEERDNMKEMGVRRR